VDRFFANICSASIIALFSSVTYLSVKHYKIYNDLFGKFMVVIVLIYLCVFSYLTGYSVCLKKIQDFAEIKL